MLERSSSDRATWKSHPLRITIIYVITGGCWILFSDWIVASLFQDPAMIHRIQTAKGWLFVAVTALILHVLIRRSFMEIFHTREVLEKKEGRLEEMWDRTVALEDRNLRLARNNIRLQEIDRLKSVFVASVSHELRTPLNSIIGFTGTLLMGLAGKLNEEQECQLKIVRESANHLLGLINDVLDLSRMEAGAVKPAIGAFCVQEAVRETLEGLACLLAAKKLDLILRLPERPVTMRSDRRRLAQIINNLMGNAIKFTEKGSVSVRVCAEAPSVPPQAETLTITVEDTGIGIRQEDMDRLFQPFLQVDDSLTRRFEGTGLGLYLTRKIANLLGGDVSAESRIGRGSRFTVTLPLALPEEKP